MCHPTYHVNAIKLKCDIIWTGWLPHLGELPRLPGVPHLHVNRPYNIADIYGLHQLINEPTRITDKSSALIDLIYTYSPERVVCSGEAHVGISDHGLFLFLPEVIF